jgi:hypothetical protein
MKNGLEGTGHARKGTPELVGQCRMLGQFLQDYSTLTPSAGTINKKSLGYPFKAVRA